jgi:integrase
LIKFLFFTGCRPSEALGLPWENIGQSTILFDRAVVYDDKGLVLKKGLKTQKNRRFPVNAQLQDLIETLTTENVQPDDLVFPSVENHKLCNMPTAECLVTL